MHNRVRQWKGSRMDFSPFLLSGGCYQSARLEPNVRSRLAPPFWKLGHPRQFCKCLTIGMSLSFVKRAGCD
ncbi:SAM-dependent methyltransferase [Pseudomonas syringae pv. actinidiae]|uniref:SAM-dependent methyltransferase n=1 Tax=Pseudomonas syringae pv. actinidiae TaxID=103796 RepID=A0A2V0QF23_PSESF|nr:SAM-dependent methyltransferase [Pseudomonas syringae pv. actinidiae]